MSVHLSYLDVKVAIPIYLLEVDPMFNLSMSVQLAFDTFLNRIVTKISYSIQVKYHIKSIVLKISKSILSF